MNINAIELAKDRDMANSLKAIRRAAKRLSGGRADWNRPDSPAWRADRPVNSDRSGSLAEADHRITAEGPARAAGSRVSMEVQACDH